MSFGFLDSSARVKAYGYSSVNSSRTASRGSQGPSHRMVLPSLGSGPSGDVDDVPLYPRRKKPTYGPRQQPAPTTKAWARPKSSPFEGATTQLSWGQQPRPRTEMARTSPDVKHDETLGWNPDSMNRLTRPLARWEDGPASDAAGFSRDGRFVGSPPVVNAEEFIENFGKSFNYNSRVFRSLIVNAETQWHEMVSKTEHLDRPHKVSTAVAAEIFYDVASAMQTTIPVLGCLKDELMRGVYIDWQDGQGTDTPFHNDTYFSRAERLEHELQRTQQQLDLERQRSQDRIIEMERMQMRLETIEEELMKKVLAKQKEVGKAHRMVKFAEYAIKLQTFWRWNDICASKKRMAKLAHKVMMAWQGKLLPTMWYKWKTFSVSKNAMRKSRHEPDAAHSEFLSRLQDFEIEAGEARVEFHRLRIMMHTKDCRIDKLQRKLRSLTSDDPEHFKERELLREYNNFLVQALLGGLHAQLTDYSDCMASMKTMDHDVSVLLRKGSDERIEDLPKLRAEDLLYRWLKFLTGREGESEVMSFSQDFRDSTVLIEVLNKIFPRLQESLDALLESVDLEQRADVIAETLQSLPFPLGSIITPEVIYAGIPDLNAAVTATLFVDYPTMMSQPLELQGLEAELQLQQKTVHRLMHSELGLRGPLLVADRRSICETLVTSTEIGTRLEAMRQHLRTCSIVWYQLVSKMNCFLRYVLSERIFGARVNVVDVKVERELRTYSKIEHQRLKDAYQDEPDIEHQQQYIQELLKRRVDDLKKTFRFYARGSSGLSAALMVGSEFIKFCTDCNILSKTLTKDKLNLIFLTSTTARASPDEVVGKNAALTPQRWLESLVRLAKGLYKSAKVGGANLEDWLETLIDVNILPNAGKFDADKLRLDMESRELKQIFAMYKELLLKVFQYYAAGNDQSSVEAMKTIDIGEFLTMAKEGKLIDNRLTVPTIKQIFANIQHDTNDGDEPGDADELDYTEFIEGVAAMSCFAEPNPYIPLHLRVQSFIVDSMATLARKAGFKKAPESLRADVGRIEKQKQADDTLFEERKQSAALEMAKQISLVTPKSGPALDRKVRIQHSN